MRALPWSASPCACVGDHRPQPVRVVKHHIVPLSWGGGEQADNIAIICDNAHANVHTLLSAWKRLGREPDWYIRRSFSPFIRQLAKRGWDAR